jgi:hypothetical protein
LIPAYLRKEKQMKLSLKVLALALALPLLAVLPAYAQLGVPSQVVTLQATIAETLTLNCTGTTVTFSGSMGTLTGAAPVSCTTAYTLAGTRSKVTLTVWANSTQTLTSGGNSITNSQVAASINGGSYNFCTGSDGNSPSLACDAGGSIVANATDGAPWPVGSVTSTIAFQITLAASQPTGTYSGTITVAATAV